MSKLTLTKAVLVNANASALWTNSLCRFLYTLLLFIVFLPAQAQPSWSRGEQRFQISFQECIRRADNALRSEGYVNMNTQANMVYGYKDDNSAVITINEGTNGWYWINIFVSSLNNNSGVPGAEREKLQQQMGKGGPGQGGPGQGLVKANPIGSFGGNWLAGSDWGFILIVQTGDQVTARYSVSGGGGFYGRVEGNRLIFYWKNDINPMEGEAIVELKSDGSMEGKWCAGKGCDASRGANFKGIKQ